MKYNVGMNYNMHAEVPNISCFQLLINVQTSMSQVNLIERWTVFYSWTDWIGDKGWIFILNVLDWCCFVTELRMRK